VTGAIVLGLLASTPALAFAQKVTTVDGLTLRQTLVQLGDPAVSRAAGEAIAFTTALEIGTQPLANSSGGFVFKLDPTTGLLARTTRTFGSSFAERALTSGEGKVSVGATFSSSNYDKISDLALDKLLFSTITANSPAVAGTTTANLELSSKTVSISGMVGVTENFDVGVIVPLVSIKLTGTSSVVNGAGTVSRLAQTSGIYSGLGDLAALAKYRLFKFKGEEIPDPGGVAVSVNMRLPTGDSDNLLGLGVTRTLVSVVASGGKGRLKPHGSAGFDYWSKSVDGVANRAPASTVSARHQIQYAAGVEVEAHAKVTLSVDFLGKHVRGAGQAGLATDTFSNSPSGITSIESLTALSEGIRKAILVPGLKVNLKGKMLLSLNALMTLKNNGLHATVTPVVGINLTM